jgi:hypothetical protein
MATITTPRGVFVWPKLNAPDFKFNSAGAFQCKLRLVKDKAQGLIDKLQPLHDQAVEDAKAKMAEMKPADRKKAEQKWQVHPLYQDVLDEEGDETGEVEFNFKMTHSGTSKKTGKPWKRVPKVFDAKGNEVKLFDKNREPLRNAPQIWGGTEGRISFEASPFYMPATGCGLSLRLEGVQIIVLRSGGGKSASEMGFGREEDDDGFDANEQSYSADEDGEGGSSGGSSDDDDTDF